MNIALNLLIDFGSIAIFIILIVTICEHGRSFHSCGIFFSVFSGLKVFTVESFTALVRFVLGILFDSSRQLHRELFP